MWDLPRRGIDPASPAPPGKSANAPVNELEWTPELLHPIKALIGRK